MTQVTVVQIKSQGYIGAPGWTTLCFSSIVPVPPLDIVQQVKIFLDGISGMMPNVWSGQIVTPVQLLQVADGVQLGEYAVLPDELVAKAGTRPEGYGAGVAGPVVSWYCASNGNGRPPRGRSFMVPVAAPVWEADGTIAEPYITNLRLQAQALIDSGVGFGVWRRPRKASLKHPVAVTGEFFTGIAARVNDRAAFLSSRRA